MVPAKSKYPDSKSCAYLLGTWLKTNKYQTVILAYLRYVSTRIIAPCDILSLCIVEPSPHYDASIKPGLHYQSFCDHSSNFAWVNEGFVRMGTDSLLTHFPQTFLTNSSKLTYAKFLLSSIDILLDSASNYSAIQNLPMQNSYCHP